MDGAMKQQRRLGGNRAVLSVYAMEGLENMAFIANSLTLVTYLYSFMNFGLTKSANTLTNFVGTAFLLSLFGGFLSDTYLSKFMASTLFASFQVLGYGVLTFQAHFEQLRPTPCNGAQLTNPSQCDSATTGQSAVLYVGLYLIAFGAGGLRAALPALGADQFDPKNPKEAPQISNFFNWFFLSLVVGAIVGVTVIVWIGENKGRDLGFGVSALAVLLSVVFIGLGKPFYRTVPPAGSPFVRIAQVFVVAMRNRDLETPKADDPLYENQGINGEILPRTNQFRFLDKAAVHVISSETDTTPNPWRQCTVTQIEETKILIRMLPIILSTVFMNTCLAQLETFTTQQGNTMNRNLAGFLVPTASVPLIPLLFMFILIPLYDRLFVPLARKFTGIPGGVRHLQRIGAGLLLSALSMGVAGLVETRRKNVAIEHDMVDSLMPLPYSVFWLGFQYAIFGAGDFLAFVGLLEFFYSESSAGMKALGTGISMCSTSFGYYLSSVIVDVVNRVSDGWLASNNLNKAKLNYFYWMLAGLSILNLGVYLICASWYIYKDIVPVENEAKQVDMDGAMKQQRRLGGNRAVLSVFAMGGLESMAFLANALSLVTYFYSFMNFGLTESANTLTNFVGTTFLLSLLGGFLSDTYFSKFLTCTLFASFEVLGFALLTFQAHFDQLRPTPCNGAQLTNPSQCDSATTGQSAVLYLGLYLIAFGAGGLRAALPALGADQFDPKNPKEAPQISNFFNWFFFSITVGAVAGVTSIVWLGENKGWDVAFGVSAMAVFLSVILFGIGKPFYRIIPPTGSPFLRIAQVLVAATRNRHLQTPKLDHSLHEKEGINGEILARTNQLRFLDKAAVVTSETHPWRLCTVTQVEETKILIRMLPIILSTIFMNTCLAQLQTFTTQQGTTMDRDLGGFLVPSSSIPVIPFLIMTILIPIYDRIFVPLARKFTGIPSGIRHLQRIGVGLFLSAVSMAVAGLVETKRKNVAIEHNMVDSLLPLPYSLFWLGFQYAIFGAAEFLTFVGLMEFFYSESSAGMKALGTGISMCSTAFGYYLSSVVVELVNAVSGGWLAGNNLNRVKLNYFYWMLAGLSVLNFGVYLICTSWYIYKEDRAEEEDDEEDKEQVEKVVV
ncbi:Protein NRT1/ PTR FAMILY 4.3 [Linum grandiflorum]